MCPMFGSRRVTCCWAGPKQARNEKAKEIVQWGKMELSEFINSAKRWQNWIVGDYKYLMYAN